MCPLLSPASSSGKWLGFVTAIWVQAVCGNNYTFSNYSDALKSIMALTQLELNTLSVAKDVGKAFGLLSGIASDRWSTSVILLIGSFEGLIGYGVQWLVVSQRIHPLPYWQMCIFLCLGGNSTTWMNTAVLVTCIRNFPNNRGPVSGILKGYVGLSTAIFTDICTALFNSNPSAFLLILAIVPAIICLAAIPFLRETTSAAGPIEEKEETRFFNIFNAIAIIAAAYLLAFDITGNHGHVVSLVFVAGLLFLLATPLFVPLYSVLLKLKSNWDIEQQIKEPLLAGPEDSPAKPQEPEPATIVSVEVDNAGIKQQPMIGEDHTIIEMIRTYDFWILFLSFLCGVGTGMCVMNNLGQMGLALGYVDVSIFVSLTSIWGFFGRIISGLVSEQLLWKFGTPRPLWNAASQVLMTLGYVIMALALPGSLYIGSILVGICYGVRLTITVAVASELFGLKYYGVLYNILILNLPLGSFLFSGLLAGYLYDAQAASSPAGGGNTCVGPHCYFLVFLIMALACVIGFGLDVLLAIRTKKKRLDNGADLSDFEVSNRYSVDNTGPVCQWPSEDVLSYFCLSHADMFRFHDKLDIQHSIDASSTAFGNTKLKTMTLHWDEEVTYNISNTFDVIVAPPFFEEFHNALACTVKLLLRNSGPLEAIFSSLKRGDTLDKLLEKVEENGLNFSIIENYDSEVWKCHQGFMAQL
ncbi:hypothetical protein D5086_010567 [Populus alba]|uniref:Uncharacterized protein n=1 Tax=Populus alba TaxID=43335 RepID=A0ACC4CCC0_POPAL